jgi:hypothetical protein
MKKACTGSMLSEKIFLILCCEKLVATILILVCFTSATGTPGSPLCLLLRLPQLHSFAD